MRRSFVFNGKGKLFHYMKEKSDYLHKKTGIHLYVEADYNEMIYMNYGYLLQELKLQVTKPYFQDNQICPQCIGYEQECEFCPYGERHGICGSYTQEDTYSQIKARSGRYTISNTMGRETILKLIKYL